jgi:hypothetical protein
VHALDVRVRHQVELLTGEHFLLDLHEERQPLVAPPIRETPFEKELPAEGRCQVAGQDSQARA